MDEKYVWIVTYWNIGTEPIVTAFDNEDAAQIFYEYFKEQSLGICIDKAKIYSKVTIEEENT